MSGLHRRRCLSNGACTLLMLLVAALLMATALPVHADDPAIPDLIYTVSSGEVVLDPTDGGSIIGYQLLSDDAFLPGNFTPVLGGVSTGLANELSEATLTGITTPSSIGNVLPAWLDAAGLDALLTSQTVSTVLGSPLVDFDLILQLPAVASNASFSTGGDVDVLNLDFGTVGVGSSPGPLGFTLANIAPVGDTSPLDLDSIGAGSGDISVLTTDLAPFSTLLAGDSLGFNAFLDTSTPGPFSASYDLNFTDLLGTDQTLTLNLSAQVDFVDDPAIPDLVYFGSTGEVFIDPTDSGGIIGYALKSDDAFTEANFTPVLPSAVTTALPGELSEASLSPLTTVESIGEVFPTGLSAAELLDLLDLRTVSTALGAPLVPFDLRLGCVIGDANCDGFVDISSDILPAFSNFTGPGSFGKVRAQGDVHGASGPTLTLNPADGDVDVSDILTMFGAFTGPPPDEAGLGASLGLLGAAEAGDPSIPDLIYDPATGEVILALDGAPGLIGYSLKSAGGFLAGGHTSILGGVSTSLSTELAEAALSTSTGSIGFVFPLGMDLATLSAFLTENTVSTGLGAPLVPFDLVVLGPAVPEPATILLSVSGLLGLGLFGWRRRKR